jgi:hypothetical protein
MNTRKLAFALLTPRLLLTCAAITVLGFSGCSSDSGGVQNKDSSGL